MKKLFSFLVACCAISITYAQKKDIQPLTGAKILQSGIRYKDLEIKVNDKFLLTPDIPIGGELKIKITEPWSFEQDKEGNVYPGVGFTIKTIKGNTVASVKNIYGDKQEGINQNYLKSLSLSITLDDKMKVGDSIIIVAKFYDTKNEDSLLITLPCKVVAKGKGQMLDGWGSFSSTYGATGMYANCTVEDFKMIKTPSTKTIAETVDTIKLNIKELGKFIEKNGKYNIKTNFLLYDENFKVILSTPMFANEAQGVTKNQLSNIEQQFILPKGFTKGIARLLIADKNSKAKVDAVLSFIYY
jgi:hypothetical protein